MNKPLSPARWANDITVILKTVFGAERFPVRVKDVAREISSQKFPDDPITLIKGDSLPRFEGALVPAPLGKKGWGIIYNSDISSTGRINFTLAHEFGHYLLHRVDHPQGIQCSSEDMASWESEYGQLEHQANVFAANLLMPFDDFRSQIDAKAIPDIDQIGACADRYEVSLIAATLRWLQYTQRRSMLVISRDGFILWARSSEPALKTGLYFRTRNQPPIEISSSSLAAQRGEIDGHSGRAEHDPGIWLNEPCTEQVLFSDQYDFTISLLHFGDSSTRFELDTEPVEDVVDKFSR
ncbi:ImmA/IrrE family metallo-endopeptidase [Nitratireductor sp. XY-223]|uniref:ImmA/IrrE family metallo-endopeptidase n=1 Tax=Nitratireductor sp. XY-223 TaxID=2561926 RepID=UPI0010A9E0E0|nr:ImmA/IrrE family metallo-endopeptidase [Nitratireductor sp. XY-223]